MYMLKSKGECLEKFKIFMALVETQSRYKFKTFHLDNGGKFILEELKHF